MAGGHMVSGHNEALARIEQAARNHQTTLDLGDLGIDHVPNAIGKLRALTELYLGHNKLVSLPDEVRQLTNLRVLELNSNKLTSLPPAIRMLRSLRSLALYDNMLTEIPDWVGELSSLSVLDLDGNAVAVLPEAISSLPSLAALGLSDNVLSKLPKSLGHVTTLKTLQLDGNPLVSPPPEIVNSGTEAVLTFLRALTASEPQWVSKMLVVGEAAVGKTSVAKLLCGLKYDHAEPQTHGVHVDRLDLQHPGLPGTRMLLNVWDFGGQLEYRATQRFYLTDRSLFLLVWNCRRGWRAGGQVEAWLQAISAVAPDSPIVIVGTHCQSSVADLDEADLYRRYPRIAKILLVDNVDGTGIDVLRSQIASCAASLPLMGQQWPNSWAAAANRLASQPGTVMALSQADDIMNAEGISAPAERAILRGVLHDRGEILHYAHDPDLDEVIILNPTWADRMITRVLDSQRITDCGGLLSRAHRNELWHDLDVGQREVLTILMERFDLAYRIDSPDRRDVALVVERIPAGRPSQLPADWTNALDEPGRSELRTIYRLSSRQAGIPSWFIAREHRFTTGVAWSRGVLLTHRGRPAATMALLEDDDQVQPTIHLTVRGQDPHTFYSILNEAFICIVRERYPGLTVRQFIPCICEPACPQEFDAAIAQRAVGLGRDLQCQQTFSMVDPRTLLLGLPPAKRDLTLENMEARLGRIENEGLTALDGIRDLLRHRGEQGAHCPSIFTVTKSGHMGHYELQLYCEQPDGPHPLPDGAGVYRLQHLPDWLRRYAPRLRILLAGLKHIVPLIGPALTGIAGEILPEIDKARLELACHLLNEIDPAPDHGPAPDRTDFTELRKALIAIDPDWGGLRERELPETKQVVYLCRTHREALHYPAHVTDA